MQKSALSKLSKDLYALPKPNKNVLVGFDGYVDKIQKVVHSKSSEGVHYFPTIAEMAVHLATLAGRSGQIELVTQELKIGGNGPIMANSLASLGVPTRCMGTMNDPIFKTMHPQCEVLSIGSPGETNAMEFEDGKLIFSEVSTFDRLTWAYLCKQFSIENWKTQIADNEIIALVDWANLNHCTDLWRGLLEDVVKPSGLSRTYFFDLCDPSKRSAEAIRESLEVISEYSPYGKVILGMNENEARKIWLALQGYSPNESSIDFPDLQEIAHFIFDKIAVETLLIHPVDRSLLVSASGLVEIQGRLVRHPKVLTGGGDNLNGGFAFGLLNGFSIIECAILGMATSGAYVQNGHSPSVQELIAYLNVWEQEI
jgi:hypothetical protein